MEGGLGAERASSSGGARPRTPREPLSAPVLEVSPSLAVPLPTRVSRSTSPFAFCRTRKSLEKQEKIPDEFSSPSSPLSIAPAVSSRDRFAEFRRRSKAQASSLKASLGTFPDNQPALNNSLTIFYKTRQLPGFRAE